MARKTPGKPAPRLSCPGCHVAFSAPGVLDHCDVSWPNQRWLGFECPRCQRVFHVEIESGRMSIGAIDGAPGPAFFPDNSVAVPGLTCANRSGGISVTLGARRWNVKGKR